MRSELYESHLRQNLADMLADADALVNARLLAIAEKSINEIIRRYTDQLTNLIYDTFRTGDAVDLRRSHKALLRDVAPLAYIEGMREGGINEPDAEDQQVLDETAANWLADQREFIDSFAKDVAAAKTDKEKRPAILARIEAWVSSLRNFGEAGKLYALGNIFLTFDGEDGKESCEDCQRLKGQRHKRNWWSDRNLLERNGNQNYECGRWDPCQHSFRDDKGAVIVS
jgi:hypothetical protein